MSVIEECDDEVLAATSIPALTCILEKAEKQAGRIVANEIAASVDGRSAVGEDVCGRQQLRKLCDAPPTTLVYNPR